MKNSHPSSFSKNADTGRYIHGLPGVQGHIPLALVHQILADHLQVLVHLKPISSFIHQSISPSVLQSFTSANFVPSQHLITVMALEGSLEGCQGFLECTLVTTKQGMLLSTVPWPERTEHSTGHHTKQLV